VNAAIDMSGRIIGEWRILDSAPGLPRGATWWCMHTCGHQQRHRGTTLRRMERGKFIVRCEGCGE
jgi:hypothetical protein